jgi:hypothetical protein
MSIHNKYWKMVISKVSQCLYKIWAAEASYWNNSLIRSISAILDRSSAAPTNSTSSSRASWEMFYRSKDSSHFLKFGTSPTSFLTSAEFTNFSMNCFILSALAMVVKAYGAK